MLANFSAFAGRLLATGAMVFVLGGMARCGQPPETGSVAIPPVPPGEARIWVYRLFEPTESLNMTAVMFNGANVGYSQMGGAFYRDVGPGRYHITVSSYGTDFSQSSDVDLAAGQEAYVQIQSLRSWVENKRNVQRDTFYARLIPSEIARPQIAQSAFFGGN
jgi:hypothetical protein